LRCRRYGPGDLGYIPPGHDAWVVGNEPFVAIDYQRLALREARVVFSFTRVEIPRSINTITDAQIEKLWELFIR